MIDSLWKSNQLCARDAICVIDIGGTSTQAGLFDARDSNGMSGPILTTQMRTPKGVAGLSEVTQNCLKTLLPSATAQNIRLMSTIGIGCPGNFDMDHPVIKPGSIKNLEISDGEFDHVNIQTLLKKQSNNI